MKGISSSGLNVPGLGLSFLGGLKCFHMDSEEVREEGGRPLADLPHPLSLPITAPLHDFDFPPEETGGGGACRELCVCLSLSSVKC